MSLDQDARVRLLLCDYAQWDPASGKLHNLGGNIALLALPDGVNSAPLTLVVIVEVPLRYVGQNFSLSIELRDETTGSIVQVPDERGALQAMRFQQVVQVPPLQLPGVTMPDDAFVANHTIVNFGNGIGLQLGHSYEWRVQIDGQGRHGRALRFHALAPMAPPVFGGPASPSSIPGVGPFGPVAGDTPPAAPEQ